MAADLRDEGSLQQQVWPTCLNLALMSEDDADEELSDPNQPVVVLRDRLITDATVADLLPACKSMTNKGSPLLGSSSTRPLMMSSANQQLANAFHIFVTNKEDDIEVEINDDSKSNHGIYLRILPTSSLSNVMQLL